MSKKRITAAAGDDVNIIPLRDWMATDTKRKDEKINNDRITDSVEHGHGNKESIIRKTTIAYGILELILRCPKDEQSNDDEDSKILLLDNFAVHVAKKPSKKQPWDDIKGVSMLSPKISLTIEEPAYLSYLFEPGEKRHLQYGRHLEVEQTSNETLDSQKDGKGCGIINEDDVGENIEKRYHLVAKILYELFTNEAYLDDAEVEVSSAEPAKKKAKSLHHQDTTLPSQQKGKMDNSNAVFQTSSVKRMQQLGVPASLCLLMQNLHDAAQPDSSSDAYASMKDVAKDLHLLLLDPDRFLFDAEVLIKEQMPIRYRKDKLYGRDEEEKLITDAFCRVSRGCSEAFFIGGFSGCGKSMLVDTLRAKVKVVGGYVIKHKFEALSQEKPLSGIISAMNQLCLKIRKNTSNTNLPALAKKVKDEFGEDLIFLARILQNVSWICPEFFIPESQEVEEVGRDKMNAFSVGYTLLRFLRLVSSSSHPIMLFLDDLQWADDTALDLVHTFLSDTMGSCIFFVGTYRDNEVDDTHPIFDMMKKLESSNVPTNKVALAGLNREDLNTMISDALCLYPRICYSLTDIVIQKTTGNPFFMLEFMKSLKDRGLLQYNIHQRRWMWDEEVIRAENITDNVMHLLSHKMTALSDKLQLVLKVMACFGTFTKESVIGYLDKSEEYAGVEDGLKLAADGGFVERSREGEFKFVHDKIREAAYNLIPESDKKQFHYNLGTVLQSVTKEKGADMDTDDIIFVIADQIYHGKEYVPKDDVSFIPILKLGIDAGRKAIESCRHETAYTYLEAASSLLPEDSWKNNYDISIRLNFLTANAANASCKYDKAETILNKILSEGRCAADKVPSYYMLIQILQGQGKLAEAYETGISILTQLGETVPESVSHEAVQNMIAETLRMHHSVYDEDWLKTKMEDKNLQSIMKIYVPMFVLAVFCQSDLMAHYLICKAVQLSLQNGLCKHTPIAFLNFSSIINRDGSHATLAHRIAKNAMSFSKNFNFSPDQMADLVFEYVYSVGYLEWFHSGVRRLRSVFESALSSGNADKAFFAVIQLTVLSIISGEKKLTSLLKEIDYYLHLLETYKDEIARLFLGIFRTTVSMLVDKKEADNSTDANNSLETGAEGDETPQIITDMIYINGAIQNYWLGYKERCCHFATKCFDSLPYYFYEYRVIVTFYYGLTLIDMLKNRSNPARRKEVREIIESMKVTVSHADCNFRNKLELLEAEQYSLEGRRSLAVKSYDAAIESAKRQKFIHEQGLACEKAGYYFKKLKDLHNAIRYFDQARACYDEWGSRLRVEMMENEMTVLDVSYEWFSLLSDSDDE